jgi:hypothetical protein
VDFVFEQQQTKRIGFYVSNQQTEFDSNAGLSNPDIDITHLHFTAMSYYPQDRLEPFILAGIGAGFFSPQDSTLDDETKFSAQVGAGTNYRFTDSLLPGYLLRQQWRRVLQRRLRDRRELPGLQPGAGKHRADVPVLTRGPSQTYGCGPGRNPHGAIDQKNPSGLVSWLTSMFLVCW